MLRCKTAAVLGASLALALGSSLTGAGVGNAGASPVVAGVACLPDDTCGNELDGYGDSIAYEGGEERVLSAACRYRRTVHAGRQYKTWWGKLLWRYWEQVTWCYNGTRIQSVWRDRWPQTYCCLWSFAGHIYNSCATEHCSELANGGPFGAHVSTVGTFKGCMAYVTACRDVNPGVTIGFNAHGNWAVNTWN
jgi:hypothetical protein